MVNPFQNFFITSLPKYQSLFMEWLNMVIKGDNQDLIITLFTVDEGNPIGTNRFYKLIRK
jgi:hypothetical protein